MEANDVANSISKRPGAGPFDQKRRMVETHVCSFEPLNERAITEE